MKRSVKADHPECKVTPPKRPRTSSNRLIELREKRANESLKSLDKSPAEQIMNVDATSGATASRICEYELQNLPNLAAPSDDDLYNLRLLASVCEDASNCA